MGTCTNLPLPIAAAPARTCRCLLRRHPAAESPSILCLAHRPAGCFPEPCCRPQVSPSPICPASTLKRSPPQCSPHILQPLAQSCCFPLQSSTVLRSRRSARSLFGRVRVSLPAL